MTNDEKVITAYAMRTYGGGFVKALGSALLQADKTNTEVLEAGFPAYIQKYGPGSDFYAEAAKTQAD